MALNYGKKFFAWLCRMYYVSPKEVHHVGTFNKDAFNLPLTFINEPSSSALSGGG